MEILVIVDYHHVYKVCQKRELSLDEIFRLLIEKIQTKGRIKEIRLFVPTYQQNIYPWKIINHLKLAYGVAVELCSVLRIGAENEERYKDLVDKEIDSWIEKHIYEGKGPELIIFVASDGDFIPSWHKVTEKGKKTEFLLIDPEATNWAILEYAPHEELESKKEEINPYTLVLRKRLKEGITTFDDAEKEKMATLKIVQKALSLLPQYGSASEITINFLTGELKKVLLIDEKEIRESLKGLIDVNALHVHPVYSTNPDSSYWQWLDIFEN